MHQHQQTTDYGKEWEGNYKFLLLRVTLLFCYSALPSWQGRGEHKTEVLILSSDNLYVWSCLYLSRAEVDMLSTQNGWAWVSWWFMSSGDTLLLSLLPFPGEDMLVEWKYCSYVPLIWHRIGNWFFYHSGWGHRAENMYSPTILFCAFCPACMAHEEKVPSLDHSAVNNSVTKEKKMTKTVAVFL